VRVRAGVCRVLQRCRCTLHALLVEGCDEQLNRYSQIVVAALQHLRRARKHTHTHAHTDLHRASPVRETHFLQDIDVLLQCVGDGRACGCLDAGCRRYEQRLSGERCVGSCGCLEAVLEWWDAGCVRSEQRFSGERFVGSCSCTSAALVVAGRPPCRLAVRSPNDVFHSDARPSCCCKAFAEGHS